MCLHLEISYLFIYLFHWRHIESLLFVYLFLKIEFFLLLFSIEFQKFTRRVKKVAARIATKTSSPITCRHWTTTAIWMRQPRRQRHHLALSTRRQFISTRQNLHRLHWESRPRIWNRPEQLFLRLEKRQTKAITQLPPPLLLLNLFPSSASRNIHQPLRKLFSF